jgi:hypothetical protein
MAVAAAATAAAAACSSCPGCKLMLERLQRCSRCCSTRQPDGNRGSSDTRCSGAAGSSSGGRCNMAGGEDAACKQQVKVSVSDACSRPNCLADCLK